MVSRRPQIRPRELAEIGNAFSAMVKRRRIDQAGTLRGWRLFQSIPLRYLEVDIGSALSLAVQANIYAYDAYFLECAIRQGAPLLTFDGQLRRIALDLDIGLIEV